MTTRSPNPIVQLTLWRVRDFTREPEALFWVFAFPIVLAFALGIAFKNRAPQRLRVAVEQGPRAAELAATLDTAPGLRAVVLSVAEARQQLRTGRVALVAVAGEPLVFRYDSTRAEGRLARLLANDAVQRAVGRRDPRAVHEARVAEPGARYIDFVLPGLLGMNIMGTGMWGVGFSVVKSRNQKLLKRLLATPMRKSEYLLSHILARLVFLAGEVIALLLFGYFVFQVPVRGSAAALAAVVLAGAMTFAGLGLLVASRVQTIEGVSGLMNLVMVPMWICSGVFFAYSNFPDAIQPVIRALPLTALNDALRAVMIDGAGLASLVVPGAVMAAWGVGSFGVALKIFRWL
ncbi:MAG TPA: ABC transporter permease [Gemmatimonadales bacterium]|nr:ABC transporter permease [Gemmatimonadales bacterium]